MKKSIEQMESERRALDREIRAAKRAAAKQAEQQLLSQRQALGVWLAETIGADTHEAIEALRAAFDPSRLSALRASIGLRVPDTSAAEPANDASKISDTSTTALGLGATDLPPDGRPDAPPTVPPEVLANAPEGGGGDVGAS